MLLFIFLQPCSPLSCVDLEKYPDGQHRDVKSFVKATLPSMHSVVDVWCEAPMRENWKETVDALSELKKEDPSSLNYHFVVGTIPFSLSRAMSCIDRLRRQVHTRTKRRVTTTSRRHGTSRRTNIHSASGGARLASTTSTSRRRETFSRQFLLDSFS
jgi:hypothetical protein